MRKHAYLPAMVGFVSKHVAQHVWTNRPRLSPSVSEKLFDAAPAVQRFGEHLRTASGAFGQSRTSLPRRAVRTVELGRNLQMRSGEPDPFGSRIVHVREDRRDGSGLTRRLGIPGGRVKIFDENLIQTIVHGEDPDCGSAELSVSLGWTRGHGLLLLDP